MFKSGMRLRDVIRSFIEEFESMEWSALSEEQRKVHVMHLRTSKPASIPIRQICRLLSAIQTITGENVLPTRNFLAFFDNGVVRETCGRSEIRQNWQRQRRR
jgi:hypothetical protein